MVIADDGSGPETRELIERMKKEVFYPIVHVWHEDNGFQKTRILNKAITQCSANYIVMSDGDCIPRKDFIAQHLKNRESGYFLSGGYFMLPMNISKQITPDDIYSGRCFSVSWLKENGLKSSFKNNKLSAGPVKSFLLNRLTPTNASWNGHNASGWKADILAVNGFDERMQYGGEDRELGERLENYGIKSKQIRYTSIVVHLDHSRGYKNRRSIDKNLAIREYTKLQKVDFTPYGIEKESDIPFQVSVIMEVKRKTQNLEKVLWAYENQLEDNFQLILTGSVSKENEIKIQEFQSKSSLYIHYFPGNESDGISKSIEAAKSDYLIFTNDSAIPRYDFVARHSARRKTQHMVFAGLIHISDQVFEEITQEDVVSQNCFTPGWLKEQKIEKKLNWQVLSNNKIKKKLLSHLPTFLVETDKTSFSIHKKEIQESGNLIGKNMRELRKQLEADGIRCLHIPFSTLVLREK